MTAQLKKKFKPFSKGQRTHERRQKQVARQEGLVYRSQLIRQPLAKKPAE